MKQKIKVVSKITVAGVTYRTLITANYDAIHYVWYFDFETSVFL